MPTRYFVTDLDRAISFYRDLLGFDVDQQWGPAFAILQNGDLTLWLSGPETSAARPMPDGRKPEPGGWNRIVVACDDVELFAEQLREAGVVFRGEVISGPGGQQVLVEDPDGNPIELFSAR